MTEKTSILRVITYAGAIIAFLIGSGFATGQEILQYYASYGFWGVFGTGSIVLILISYVAVECFLTGRREQFEKPSPVFYHYGGKYIGTFFDYFSILFVFLSFTVMIAGAGAVFEEYYGLSKFVGGIVLAAVVGLTVWFGLTSLVDVIGKTVKNRREATAGGLVGGIAFSLACMIVGLGLLANMAQVYDAEIPMLVLAGDLGPSSSRPHRRCGAGGGGIGRSSAHRGAARPELQPGRSVRPAP